MTTAQKIIKYAATAFAAFLAVSIVAAVLNVFLLLIGFNGSDKNTKTTENSYQAKEIKNLHISCDIGDITFKQSNSDKVVIKASKVAESYSCKLDKDGKLVIKNKNKKYISSFFSHKSSKITIYVPKDAAINMLTINGGVGDTKLNNITIGKLTFHSGVGDTDIKNCSITSSDFDMGIGDITVKNSELKDVNVDNGIGDIELSIDGDIDDYDFDIDTGIGDKEINGKSYSHYKNLKSNYSIKCDNGIGDIDIDIH